MTQLLEHHAMPKNKLPLTGCGRTSFNCK